MKSGEPINLRVPNLVAAILLSCSVLPCRSPAEILSFNFSGEITSKSDASNFFGGAFESGSQFAGTVTVDTALAGPDLYPDDPKLGVYGFSSEQVGQFALTVRAGEHAVVGKLSSIAVHDDPRGSLGGEHLGYGAIMKTYDGVALPATFTEHGYAIGFTRTKSPFNAITTDALPTNIPVLSAFNSAHLTIYARDPTRGISFNVAGTVKTVTPVPEPTTGTLLLAFVVTSAVFRKDQWRRRVSPVGA